MPITTDAIRRQNTLAEERRALDAMLGQRPSLAERMRHYPYHGYVDVQLPTGGGIVMLMCNDDYVALNQFWGTPIEPASVAAWCRLMAFAPPCVLDVGAYTGLYALLAAAASPKTKVHAFEPVPRIHARTIQNRTVNGLANLQVHRLAAGPSPGTFRFHLHAGDSVLPTGSSLEPGEREAVEIIDVQVEALDAFAVARHLPRIGLVKIDAERTEIGVLRGMRVILDRWQPDVLIEILGLAERAAVLELLAGTGYRLLHIEEEGRRLVTEGTPNLPLGMNFLMTRRTDQALATIFQGVLDIASASP